MASADITACTACGAKNRLKPGPSDAVPVCGRCQSALPWLVQAQDSDFDAHLAAPVPVLVDFWADWCGPCRMVAPVLETLARERAGRLKVAKLDVDANPLVASRYGVRSIPTLMVFVDGAAVDTIVGAVPKHQIVARLDRLGA